MMITGEVFTNQGVAPLSMVSDYNTKFKQNIKKKNMWIIYNWWFQMRKWYWLGVFFANFLLFIFLSEFYVDRWCCSCRQNVWIKIATHNIKFIYLFFCRINGMRRNIFFFVFSKQIKQYLLLFRSNCSNWVNI